MSGRRELEGEFHRAMLDRILADREKGTACIVGACFESAINALGELATFAEARGMNVKFRSRDTVDIDRARFYAASASSADPNLRTMYPGRRYVLPWDERIIRDRLWLQWTQRVDPRKGTEWIDSLVQERDLNLMDQKS